MTAYNMADLSVAWHFAHTFAEGNMGGSIVIGNYAYFKCNACNYLYKLNLSDGSLAGSLDIGGYTPSSYASPIYDPSNGYLYSLGAANVLAAINPITMAEVWNHTFAAGSGSDNDYISYTEMTTPLVHQAICTNSQILVVPVREDASNSNQYKVKLFAISCTTGYKAWVNLSPWNYNTPTGARMGNSGAVIITDTYLITAATDQIDTTRGVFWIIQTSNGSEIKVGALAGGVWCGGIFSTSQGRIFMVEKSNTSSGGGIEAIMVGRGPSINSNLKHFGKNANHNHYFPDLVVDTSLTFYY
jgi:hypothetical protein